MKCRDKHTRDKVPGATYQGCLSKRGVALRGHHQLLQEQGTGGLGQGWPGLGGAQGRRGFQSLGLSTGQGRC